MVAHTLETGLHYALSTDEPAKKGLRKKWKGEGRNPTLSTKKKETREQRTNGGEGHIMVSSICICANT